jgi:hypothetical protein
LFCRSFDWSVSHLVGQLIGWSLVRLVSCLVSCLVRHLVSCSVSCLISHLVSCLVGQSIVQSISYFFVSIEFIGSKLKVCSHSSQQNRRGSYHVHHSGRACAIFLGPSKRLYKRLCPSVGWFIGWLVRWLVDPSVPTLLRPRRACAWFEFLFFIQIDK